MDAHALQRVSININDPSADRKVSRRSDFHHHISAVLAALHVRDLTSHDVSPHGRKSFVVYRRVKSEAAIAKIPIVSQHVTIRIACIGGKLHRITGSDGQGARSEGKRGRQIVWERADVHDDIDPFVTRIGAAALRDGRQIKRNFRIGKGAADGHRRVILAGGGIGGGVDQGIAGEAVGVPVQLDTGGHPRVGWKTLAISRPVIPPAKGLPSAKVEFGEALVRVLAHAHGVNVAGADVWRVKGIDAIGFGNWRGSWDDARELVRKPIHVVLGRGAKVAAATAHHVEGISVLLNRDIFGSKPEGSIHVVMTYVAVPVEWIGRSA